MKQQHNRGWRLTPVIRDDENLRRIARASNRALQCRADGMERRLIVAMLNRWWPGLAIRPWGIWDDTAMLMATNAVRHIVDTASEGDPLLDDNDTPTFQLMFGKRIVKRIFEVTADVLPDDMKGINRLLMSEAMAATQRSELESVIETMTGVPYSA